jgi:hypothetical protein
LTAILNDVPLILKVLIPKIYPGGVSENFFNYFSVRAVGGDVSPLANRPLCARRGEFSARQGASEQGNKGARKQLLRAEECDCSCGVKLDKRNLARTRGLIVRSEKRTAGAKAHED